MVMTAKPQSNVALTASDQWRFQKLIGTPNICRNTPRHKKEIRAMVRQQARDL